MGSPGPVAARHTLTILGVMLLLIGVVWFLQGIGVIPGSFMTGENFWAAAGALAAIAGTMLIGAARRRRPKNGPDSVPPVGRESDETPNGS